MNDPYETWDAAYVLGSLSSTERREYEAHLSGCVPCRTSVGELSGMPALLAMLSPDEVTAIDTGGIEPPPLRPQLLDGVLFEVRPRPRPGRGGLSRAGPRVVSGLGRVAADALSFSVQAQKRNGF